LDLFESLIGKEVSAVVTNGRAVAGILTEVNGDSPYSWACIVLKARNGRRVVVPAESLFYLEVLE
jgi:hypothetical protein